MLKLPSHAKDFISQGLPTAATLWEFACQDGTVKRFTTFDQAVVYENNTYYPAQSIRPTAREFNEGLRAENLELLGAIDSEEITERDLRNGKYDRAVVTETLINFDASPVRAIITRKYLVKGVSWNGVIWEAEVGSVTDRLLQVIGDYFSRSCIRNLGDSGCGVVLADYTETGEVVSVVSPSRTFTSTVSADVGHNNTGVLDGYFDEGILTWTSGDNAGVKSEVKIYTESNGRIELHYQTGSGIKVGDEFTVSRGCRKTTSACKLFADYISGPVPVLNNIKNHLGFDFIPHNDQAANTPDFPEET